MRWNGLRHLRNANTLRHAVTGLVRSFSPGKPTSTDSSQKKSPQPQGGKRPPKKLKAAVRKVTGSGKAKTPQKRQAIANKIRAQRSTSQGRRSLRTSVSRQLGSP